jgi:succinate-acetate transporter protein
MESAPQSPAAPNPFAESSPLGLLGLSVGCAALLPIAFGQALTPDAFRTCAMFCLLFGGGCQLIAGLMALANKNLLGGTLFTTFAFNWGMNYWSLMGIADGKLPNGHIVFAVDCCFLVIFTVLMFAFGYFSKLLFAFLADIVLLFTFRILADLLHTKAFAMPIAACTVGLAAIALWLALAILLNSAAGRVVLPIPGPLFKAGPGAPPPAHG